MAAGSWRLGVGIMAACLAGELMLGAVKFGFARSLRVLAAHMLSHAEAMDSYGQTRTASMHEWTAKLGLRNAQTAFEERRVKELR